MLAVDQLKEEHTLIRRMLERNARALSPFDGDAIRRELGFFVHFVDWVHHGREEDVLFTELLARARPAAAEAIREVLALQEAGRQVLNAARESLHASLAGDARGVESAVRSFTRYAEIL